MLCRPNSEPPISANASQAMYEPQISAKTTANSAGRKSVASCAPTGTRMNLNAAQSVVMSRQFARASTPSMTRD
jgi:hypothetical protein